MGRQQTAEGSRQRAEWRRQNSEDGRQKREDAGQGSGRAVGLRRWMHHVDTEGTEKRSEEKRPIWSTGPSLSAFSVPAVSPW